jgi:selenide,water dikinase
MSTLNRAAGEAMLRAGDAVHAATDVTGFGLLGHLSEMLGDGTVGARVGLERVPVLADAWDFAEQEVVPGGSRRNLASIESFMDWSERITPTQQLVLADAQTSGGLLMAVDASRVEAVLADLRGHGVGAATVIGAFTDHVGRIEVT